MKAEVRIEGLDGLRQKLGELSGPIIDEEMEAAMDNSLFLVESSAVSNVDKSPPEHPQVQTSRLKGSIMSEKYWVGDMLEGDAGSNVEYGPGLEYGNPPHRIEAKTGGSLRFQDPITGEWVFAKSVDHPGNPPYPWLDPALTENEGRIQNEFDNAVARAVNRASK